MPDPNVIALEKLALGYCIAVLKNCVLANLFFSIYVILANMRQAVIFFRLCLLSAKTFRWKVKKKTTKQNCVHTDSDAFIFLTNISYKYLTFFANVKHRFPHLG